MSREDILSVVSGQAETLEPLGAGKERWQCSIARPPRPTR